MNTRKLSRNSLMLALAVGLMTGAAYAQDETPAQERAELDREAETALEQLFNEEPNAQRLYEQAAAYAVFTNYKFAAGIVAGGGNGVAINKQTNERTYMDMGTAGVAAGLGGQKYHLVMLFETEDDLNEFITDGWEATASANAVAGEAGANVATNFREGVLIYPLTEAGLMLNADISGTRFWVDEELNQGAGVQEQEEIFEDEPEMDDDDLLTNEDVIEHERQLEQQ